jgi:UDP-N-acetylmuramyl tripeptide synthase
MKHKYSILIGKTVRSLARLRGGGSALPGLVVERLDPAFMAKALSQLPKGVVLVTGTNGKTTTTKMIAQLLSANGLSVLTNPTGSNFTRGIIAALLEAMDLQGRLHHDIAVLELDEVYAKHFVQQVKPRYVVVLNIMRDQLDRFGEIDATTQLLQTVTQAATECAVLNRDDPRVASLAKTLEIPVHYFGATPDLHHLFVSDDDLHADPVSAQPKHVADVELAGFDGQKVTYTSGKVRRTITMQLSGVYNFLNGAAALTTTKLFLPDVDDKKLLTQLETVRPAFGRGEIIMVNGQPCELVLVKNPGGFRLSLVSFAHKDSATMITINDNYADGRDVSWLWDVDFSGLKTAGVQMVSGIRAYDMALRLQYDEVEIKLTVEPNLTKALREFINSTPDKPKRIFCTYTAMLDIRKALKKDRLA